MSNWLKHLLYIFIGGLLLIPTISFACGDPSCAGLGFHSVVRATLQMLLGVAYIMLSIQLYKKAKSITFWKIVLFALLLGVAYLFFMTVSSLIEIMHIPRFGIDIWPQIVIGVLVDVLNAIWLLSVIAGPVIILCSIVRSIVRRYGQTRSKVNMNRNK